MSRIDEALKRAGEGPDRWELRGGAPVRTDAALDRYAAEAARGHAGAAVRRPRAIGLEASSPESPTRVLPTAAASNPRLVASREAPALLIEQCRRLAASLHDVQHQRGIKTVLVSSALPREGKTMTACNLALTLSESYHRKVLVIDADLRRPAIHQVFGLRNTTGLIDVLRHNTSAPLVDLSEHLSVLPAGRSGDDHLARLSSDSLLAAVTDAAERFDWIVLDTPPIGLLPDARHMTRVADAVVFVVAAGVAPYHVVQSALADLGPERIVGVVLNRVDPHAVALASYYGTYCPPTRDEPRV